MRSIALVAALAVIATVGCGRAPQPSSPATPAATLHIVSDIQARRAQFAPMAISAQLDELPASERTALTHLVRAAKVMDEIFLRQVWQANPEFSSRVAALTGPDGNAAKDYYRIMFGPWDRLAAFEPFVGDTPHPDGAGFYPEDLTKQEFTEWIAAHPTDKEAFTSTVTVIRRDGQGLKAVPYSQAYHDLLAKAADELRAAAAATSNASLKKFCELRAKAFLDDDYFASDLAWMDLDSPIEIVIGPYETYEDALFGYKASFESFVCVAQPTDSKRLAVFKGELPWLEEHLPIPDKFKNPHRGSDSPIRVVDEVFTAGDAKAGVQTLAFNLPNDERVREAKGSKKVLLKNMMHAKFSAILTPIAARVLTGDDLNKLSFDSYFYFTLFHELSHGLGPGRIVKDGQQTEVRLELKDLYSAIEEAKADVLGITTLYQLADKGVVPPEVVAGLPWTYTAGLFRSIRFGATEAHGLGVAVQANVLLQKGAIEVTADGRFQPVPAKFRPAMSELAHDLLMIEALGDYAGAQALTQKDGHVPASMQSLIDGFQGIPVDVEPQYTFLE